MRLALLTSKIEPKLLLAPISNIFTQTFYTLMPVGFTSILISIYEKGQTNNYSFNQTFWGIILATGIFAAINLILYIYGRIISFINEFALIDFRARFKERSFVLIKQVDYEMHEKTSFLNDYTRLVDEGADDAYNCMNSLSYLASAVFSVIAIFAIFASVHYLILIFAGVMATINFLVQKKLVKLNYELSQKQQPNFRERGYVRRMFYLKDALEDIKTTDIDKLLLGINDKVGDRVIKNSDLYARKRWIIAFIADSLMNFIYPVALGFLAWYSLKNLEMSRFVALTVAASTLVWQTRGIIDNITWVEYAIAYSDYVIRVIDQKGKIETSTGEDAGGRFHSLQLENICFGYEADKQVLKNISMTIKRGEKVAIVGHNGAGKTTLIKLILRLYETSTGHRFFNGREYEALDPHCLRSHIGVVFQNFEVYAMTISENILLRPVKTPEDRVLVWDALRFCGLEEEVKSFPKGIDTELTKEFDDGGMVLSGGQRQKVAIARAYASRAELIILDEPSSSLDPISEYDLYERMMRLGEDRALIFISHRLSTTVKADRIYVIENGEIIEQGTHQDLMKISDGKYKEMFNAQAENYTEQGEKQYA
jgi:ATP-binding cassette subfamily B protein